MKALTLTQPWASLVAIGAKCIETRSWRTDYRGPLAIHAAKGLGPVLGYRGLITLCFDEPFRSALAAGGYAPGLGGPELPLGAVVAVAELVACLPVWHPRVRAYLASEGTGEVAFGDYTPGRFAWLLRFVRRLDVPIPARGALGLWDWEPPAAGVPVQLGLDAAAVRP